MGRNIMLFEEIKSLANFVEPLNLNYYLLENGRWYRAAIKKNWTIFDSLSGAIWAWHECEKPNFLNENCKLYSKNENPRYFN